MTSEETFFVLLSSVELVLFVNSVRRTKFLLIPNGALGLILFYQFVFLMVNQGFVDNIELLSYGANGLHTNYYFAQGFYAFLFVLVYLATLDMKAPPRSAAIQASFTALSPARLDTINQAALAAASVYALTFSIGIKWSIIWSNNEYLEMTDPERALAINSSIFALALSLLLPVGVICATLSAINLSRKNYFYAASFTFFWAFVAIFEFGSHERGATLVSGMFLITYFSLAIKPSKAVLAVVGLFALVSYPAALAGRLNGQQGLASIPETFDLAFSVSASDFSSIAVTNLGEGIFIFAESLEAPVDYPVSYKILSFSPLPSALDGFSSIRQTYQVRLTETVPLSGYAEVLKFGYGYAILLAIYLIAIIRLNHALERKNQLAFLLVNTFIFLGFFMFSAYPLRTGLRLFVVAALVAGATLIFDKTSVSDASAEEASDSDEGVSKLDMGLQ